MSMSEFEDLSEESNTDTFHFPADFSEDDVEFARELDELFSIENEDMPPLFVQTMMSETHPSLQAIDDAFEMKTRAQVLRRLNVKRRLFRSPFPSPRSLFDSLISASRPFVVSVTSALLILVTSLVITAPTFASGLSYLWTGAHSGVLQVNVLPHITTNSDSVINSQPPAKPASDPSRISLPDAVSQLHFPLSLPQSVPARYSQQDLYLYQGDPSWADGPIMILDYTYALPGIAPRHITICEFKPQGNVFQVVQDGAAQRILLKQSDGSQSTAIYVEGYWSHSGDSSYTWNYADRSELVFSVNNVAFWIVGDKMDDIDKDELSVIANSLEPYHVPVDRVGGHLEVIQGDVGPRMFDDDVIYLDNPDNVDGPSFKLIGTPTVPHVQSYRSFTQNKIN